ncbi:MAG TPA: MFS transporter [Candidatus Nanoarchaeia archaeon]|nr:MFS transporter [Candidatus Nanoarchaeia archaeon]
MAERKQPLKQSLMPLLFVVFLDLVGIGIIIPIIGPLFLSTDSVLPHATSFATRTILMGFLIASYPIAQFFGAPILGALSDRHGRKKLLLTSLAGTFVGYLLFALALVTHNLPLLFISRIIDGFTGGNISIAMSSIADLSDEKSKAKNFGLIGMAFGLGFIFGPFIGGKLSDPAIVSWFSLATPIWFAAILTALNILLLIFNFSETSTTRIHSEVSILTGFKNIKKVFSFPNLRVIFIVVFLLTFGFNFFTQFFQVFLIEKFNYTQSDIGEIFAYAGLWIAFSQGFVTRIVAKKFGPRKVLSVSSLLLGLSLPLLVIPDKSAYLYFVMPLIALFQGLTMPNYTAIISGLSAKDSQGEILGISQSIQSLGMAIPPIIAGFIISFNLNLPLIAAGALTLLAWLVFILFFRKKEKKLFHEV